MFKLPKMLKHRLIQFGLSQEEIDTQIQEYQMEAGDYLSLVIPEVVLTPNQTDILTDAYIQYKLFAMIELEGLVADKKQFLSELISTIKENYYDKKSEEKEKKNTKNQRIKVF